MNRTLNPITAAIRSQANARRLRERQHEGPKSMTQQLQAEVEALNRIIVHQASMLLAKDQQIQHLSANALAKINELSAESKAIGEELATVKKALAIATEPKTVDAEVRGSTDVRQEPAEAIPG